MRQYLEEALEQLKEESIVELDESKEKGLKLKVEYENADEKDATINTLVDMYDAQLNEELLEEDFEKFKMTQDQFDRMMKEFSIAEDMIVFVTDSGFVGFKRFPFSKVKLAGNQNRVMSVAKNTTLDEINAKLAKVEMKLNSAEALAKIAQIKADCKPARRTDVSAGVERDVPVEIWEERLKQAIADPDGKNREAKESRAVFGISVKDTSYTTPVCENAEAGAQFVGDPNKDIASTSIYQCCDNKLNSYFGYYWSYASPEDIKEKIDFIKSQEA